MSERKAGWYWVKLRHGEWVPCEWLPDADYPDDAECWVDAPLSPMGYARDEQFEQIGPRIPTPDEPWKCVPVQPTRKMRQAGDIAKNDCYIEGIYADMLYTAPKP